MNARTKSGAGARKRASRHVVVLGGGGFSGGEQHTLIDDFVLGLTGKVRPRVCFVATASGDSVGYIERFRAAFGPDRARASFVSLFARGRRTLESQIMGQDVIYVGGGSTANLLAVWRLHGLDKVILRAHKSGREQGGGAVLAGVSAGMLCWFEACLTDSFGPVAPMRDGLGLLKGAACPHYDGERERRPMCEGLIAGRKLPGGVACDDHAAAHYSNGELVGGVSEVRGKGVFMVAKRGAEAVTTPVATRYLGSDTGA